MVSRVSDGWVSSQVLDTPRGSVRWDQEIIPELLVQKVQMARARLAPVGRECPVLALGAVYDRRAMLGTGDGSGWLSWGKLWR